jgi:hypothetical protein
VANQSIISKFIAASLFVLFLLSITPKKILHDLVACHTDTSSSSTQKNTPVAVEKAGFHCQLDNLVAESPFEKPKQISSPKIDTWYNGFVRISICAVQLSLPETSLRGPPFHT